MNSDSVILIAPPFITADVNSWVVFPPIPIEADMVYHIRTSFQEHSKVPFFEPDWKIEENIVTGTFVSGSVTMTRKLLPLEVVYDSIDDCFEKASDVSDTVNFLFLWNIEPHLSPNMIHIFEKIKSYRKKGKDVRILSIIPDAWPRGIDLISLVSSHLLVCDKTIVLYEGLKPFLLNQNRSDLADRLDYFPCAFMSLNKEKIENKTTDFCFIGRVNDAYSHRGIALELIQQSFPEKNFFVYTDGKTTNPNNTLFKTKTYLDKTGDAQYSIVTSTRPTSLINANYNYNQWKSVLPARLAESIINMTIPIYVQFSKNDRLPEIIDHYDAWIYVQANDTPDEVRKKIESVSIEEMKIKMMKFYNDFISPNVLIPKLLERT